MRRWLIASQLYLIYYHRFNLRTISHIYFPYTVRNGSFMSYRVTLFGTSLSLRINTVPISIDEVYYKIVKDGGILNAYKKHLLQNERFNINQNGLYITSHNGGTYQESLTYLYNISRCLSVCLSVCLRTYLRENGRS